MSFAKYLIQITDPRIPDIIYATFPDITHNAELLNKVYKMWRLGNDSEYAQLYFAKHNVGTLLTKLSGYKIDTDKKVIRVMLSNGFICLIPLDLFGNIDIDTLIDVLRLPMQITVKHVKGVLIADNVKVPTLQSAEDIGKEIVEEIGALNALLIGYGIMPHKDTYFLFLPRIMALFKGFRYPHESFPTFPIHVLQFTEPNTGKTHFAVRTVDIANYEYMGGELPTLTRLVYDARSGAIGTVGLRDGIILDEFDKKTANDLVKLTTDLRALLTGMEQCVWSRSAGAKPIEIRRCVNFVFLGNIPPYMKGGDSRQKIVQYYNVSGMDALVDRITIVDIWASEINIANYVLHRIMPNYVVRGIVEYITKNLKPEEVSVDVKGGRIARHAMNIKTLLKALGVNLSDEVVAYIAQGLYTFDMLNRATPTDELAKTITDAKYLNNIKDALK